MTNALKAPILLCCATKWESSPLIQRWGLSEVKSLQYEGSVRCVDVVLIKTGIGAPHVREALARQAAPRLAISVGFAGALQPGMASGDLVLDVQGLDLAVPQAAREIAAARKVPLHFGRIAHADTVLSRPEDKAALGKAQRCSVVDMESATIKAWSASHGVAFLGARVVLDALDDLLPSEIPAGETAAELIPFVLRNFTDLPTLARVGWLQRRAIARLATFLEDLLPSL